MELCKYTVPERYVLQIPGISYRLQVFLTGSTEQCQKIKSNTVMLPEVTAGRHTQGPQTVFGEEGGGGGGGDGGRVGDEDGDGGGGRGRRGT